MRIGSRRGTSVKTRLKTGLSCRWGAESCLGGCSLLLKAPSPGSCSWHHLYLYLNNHGEKRIGKNQQDSAGLPSARCHRLVWRCSSPRCSTCLRELLNWCQVVQRCRNQVSPVPVLPGGGFQSLSGSQEHEESVASFSTGFSTLGLGLSSRGVLVERSGRENGRKARSAEKSEDLGGGRAAEMVWDWVRAGGELLLWLEAFKTKKFLKPTSF